MALVTAHFYALTLFVFLLLRPLGLILKILNPLFFSVPCSKKHKALGGPHNYTRLKFLVKDTAAKYLESIQEQMVTSVILVAGFFLL